MKFSKHLFLPSILTFAALVGMKLYGDSQESFRIVGVVGSNQVVILSRSVLISDVDVTVINTSGTDTWFMGGLELGLFSSTGSYYLDVTSVNADSDNLFRMIQNGDPANVIYLYVTSDTLSSGQKSPKPVELKNGTQLRSIKEGSVDNEVQNLSIYAKDNRGNSTAAGIYETQLMFAWHSAS